ncbi:MAG: glutaredoxin 3 [Methylotenera sp.]|uniref:glutaredoxin 3 n=1 Tax=Methylotenera sp. TaxID=2051956 RepID=UPI0024876B0B|nr:glutaredoxin 3 [Methylotenera sp.]MDI1309311.1 glutaredoxin 3 [Methylotenera sp.]
MTNITIYSTSTCPYCVAAENFLANKGFSQINKILVDRLSNERDAMIQRTGRRTVPQIFINDIHVSGYDDLVDLDRKGGLDAILNA